MPAGSFYAGQVIFLQHTIFMNKSVTFLPPLDLILRRCSVVDAHWQKGRQSLKRYGGDRKIFWPLPPSLFIFSSDPPSCIIHFFLENPLLPNLAFRVGRDNIFFFTPPLLTYFWLGPPLLHYIFSFPVTPTCTLLNGIALTPVRQKMKGLFFVSRCPVKHIPAFYYVTYRTAYHLICQHSHLFCHIL